MPPEAKTDYKKFVDAFIHFGSVQPGTHVSQVSLAIEKALSVSDPPLRYCVGIDSKVSPIVGLLPTKMKEGLLIKQIFASVKE